MKKYSESRHTKAPDTSAIDDVHNAYVSIMSLVGNKTRWRILYGLVQRKYITWTDMRRDLRINPYMIKHHTGLLSKAGLIEKSRKRPGFRLTKAGKAVMSMSIEEATRTAELGREIAKKLEIQ